MAKTTKNNLSSTELARRVKNLRPGDTFAVRTPTERGVASGIAKNLRNAGVIDFIVASRKNEAGEFIFYIVPT